MDQMFIDELEFYETNPQLYINKLYNFISSNISRFTCLNENLLCMERVAKENNDKLLLSLFYFSNYLVKYPLDLKLSFNDLKESLNVIEQVDNFKKYDLYYAILLSFAIYYNQNDEIEKGLNLTLSVLDYLNKTNNINFIIQFNINLSYIYFELGLKKEAISLINAYDPNYRYLYNKIRRHLLTALIFGYYENKMPDKMLECIKILEEDIKYSKDYYKSLKNSYYLMYYLLVSDSINATRYYDLLMSDYKDINETIKKPGALDRSTIFLVFARYLNFVNKKKEAFELYKFIVKNINIYNGSRIEILDEAINLAFELNEFEFAKVNYKLIRTYQKRYCLLSRNLIKSSNDRIRVNHETAINGYNRIIRSINIVNSFMKDMFRASSLIQIEEDFNDLTHRFSPNCKVKMLFVIEGKLCSFNNGKLQKLKSNFDYNSLKHNFMNKIPLSLKLQFSDYDYITPLTFNNEVVGFLIYDEALFNDLDDSTKPLGKEAILASGDAIYKFNYFKEINEKSNIDELTRALNRRSLQNFIDTYSFDKPLYLIEFDLDDFKKINDTYGHPCGDYVLRCIAVKLQRIFSKNNVYRIGGEEFICLTHMDKKDITERLLRLENDMKNIPLLYKDFKLFVTLSYGGTILDSKKAFTKVYGKADELLYKVKKSGKGKGIIE